MRPRRFELLTYSFGGCRSIQLSYGRIFIPNKFRKLPTHTCPGIHRQQGLCGEAVAEWEKGSLEGVYQRRSLEYSLGYRDDD